MTEAAVSAEARSEPVRGRRKGRVLRGIGKTLLTAAAILAAYIVWLLWGTGFYYDSQQSGLREDLERRIESAGPAPGPVVPGQAYAILRIPELELNEVVIEGTETEALKKGPGHYEETADPWEDQGRVGIAGHRTTYGAPFWDLNLLEPGDDIRLVTERGTFDYEVSRTEVVLPSASQVLDATRQPSLVLTTCNPRFSAAERLIVFAERVDAV
ncbi:MAG: sortase [Actinomycetota bacterium]|nr:sortase [Actinomycetota bacterium]